MASLDATVVATALLDVMVVAMASLEVMVVAMASLLIALPDYWSLASLKGLNSINRDELSLLKTEYINHSNRMVAGPC